jgi:hypothetical protein
MVAPDALTPTHIYGISVTKWLATWKVTITTVRTYVRKQSGPTPCSDFGTTKST